MGKGGLQERMRLARLEKMAKEREVTNPLPELVRGRLEIISESTRRNIAAIADRLAPYEEFARSTGRGPEDQVALFEVLEDAGAINDDLVKAVRAVGRSMAADQAAAEERFFKYVPNPDSHPGSGEKILKVDVAGFNARVDDQSREMGDIIGRAEKQKRQLFLRFMQEILCHSYVSSVMNKIRRFKKMDALGGFAAALTDTEVSGMEGADPPHQAAVVSWFRLAEGFARVKKDIEKPEFVEGASSEEAFQELKKVTFEETTRGGGWKVPLVGLRWRGSDIICEVSVHKDQPSIAICEFILVDARGVHITDGHISRITGDLAVSGTMTVSAGDIFDFFQDRERYRILRDHVLAGIYKLWKEKDLQEEVDVVFSNDDEDDEEGEEEGEEALVSSSGALSKERRPSRAEMLQAFEAQYGPQKVREKRAIVEEGELSGYSWRRVLDAFRRCGVRVVMEGDHPKLQHEGRTMDYINRHEDDPRRNRAVVNKMLRKLGIPKEEFRKNLY